MLGLNAHDLEPDSRDQLRSLNVKRVRTTIYWDKWIADPSYQGWRIHMLRSAIRESFELLIVAHGTPPHAQGYSDFMAELAELFPEADFQLGNEEPVWDCDGGEWADAHDAAYRAIKDVSPRSKVCTLGFGWSHLSDRWAQDFFGSGPEFDAIAIHLYHSWLPEALEDAVGMVPPHHPIWITEFGSDESEPTQMIQWRTVVTRNDELRFAERMYGYALKTDESGHFGRIETHGIIAPDGRRKPTALWVREYNAALTPTEDRP